MKNSNKDSVTVDSLKLELKAYVERRFGEKLTQKDVGDVLFMSIGAVATISVELLPKQKSGTSRTSPVIYAADDVVNFMVARHLSVRKTEVK